MLGVEGLMVMAKEGRTGTAASAREKARSAKAALDAARVEHDKKVEDAATGYYSAIEQAEAAQAALAAATTARAAALVTLIELGEPNETIEALCEGVSATELRAARAALRPKRALADKPAAPVAPVVADGHGDGHDLATTGAEGWSQT